MPIAAPNATLAAIEQKVRRITRTPSENQLSTADLDNYINTFLLYNLPQNLKLYNLRSTFTFYTQPNIDTYATETNDPTNVFYNFAQNVSAVHPSAYLAGIPGLFTEWRDVFYGYYPQFTSIAQLPIQGDGTPGPFTGYLSAVPILQNDVIFSTIDANNNSLILVDYPVSNTTGALGLQNVKTTSLTQYGFINYITGQFSLTFPSNTAAGAQITASTLPYQAGKPTCVLYYNQQFKIRPVPDKTYSIQLEVDMLPTYFLSQNQLPQINQWWQYIAYGAAKLIFEDRMDQDSVQLILPEFLAQEMLVQRATLTTYANERTLTIYTQGKQYGWGWGFGEGGWPY